MYTEHQNIIQPENKSSTNNVWKVQKLEEIGNKTKFCY